LEDLVLQGGNPDRASLGFRVTLGCSPASSVLSRRYDFLPSVPLRFVAFARRYLGCTRAFALRRTSAPSKPGVGSPVLQPGIAEEMAGSPKFLGNSNCPFAHVPFRPRQDDNVRPIRRCHAAPGMKKAKAPTKGVSRLNCMAFGLAVYASQCGLLQPHARLASGF